MTADNFLIFGIVLIVASVALGLIAYAFVLNRRESEKIEEESTPPAPGEPQAAAEAEPALRQAVEPAAAPVAAPAKPPILAPLPVVLPPSAPIPAPLPVVLPASPPAVLPPSPAASARPVATPIAVIMREDASGQFFLRMGERELRRPEDVREATDRLLLDSLLGALNKLAARPKPGMGMPAAEGYVETPSRPLSMIEQINAIVEKKLAELPGSQRAVRLVEGAAGSVRVYVGVDRYDTIDAVPDAEVRRVIREAVAEWEARA